MQKVFGNISNVANLLDLACSEMNAESINELALGKWASIFGPRT